MNAVMQRENETARVVLEGRRTDDGDRCTLAMIREVSGAWALYPHGAAQLGVRLGRECVDAMAQAILAAAE